MSSTSFKVEQASKEAIVSKVNVHGCFFTVNFPSHLTPNPDADEYIYTRSLKESVYIYVSLLQISASFRSAAEAGSPKGIRNHLSAPAWVL
jgi:hypothetical protein